MEGGLELLELFMLRRRSSSAMRASNFAISFVCFSIILACSATNSANVLSDNEIFIFDMADLQRHFEGVIYGKRYARYLLMKLDILSIGYVSDLFTS